MKEILSEIVRKSLDSCLADGTLTSGARPDIIIEKPAHEEHGDFATNIAMLLAKPEKKSPRAIADAIVGHIDAAGHICEKVEIAGPGFINFHIRKSFWLQTLKTVAAAGDSFGRSLIGTGRKVQVEFVSANPTGPLHIGHGRGAATGDAVASVLEAAGFDVFREYYINDAGNQMSTLGKSIYLRYMELFGRHPEFPANCYQGDYIRDISRDAIAKFGDKYVGADEAEAEAFFARFGGDIILKGIGDDLKDFGISFDNWYSEQSLFDGGKVDT
ncbi:MAG TPA: arginine--tRNA ligase, partial [Geobacteraceae bacterium]|nr:arginine--tRNA ligase [Geobacteraceae bacterium]